jgi:L-seryl-tRNA(Ser) seleniumtransferase
LQSVTTTLSNTMSIHDRYRLSVVINAKGTYTPLGVSRSSDGVAAAVAQALPEFFVMDELGDRASEAIAQVTGAQAGAVVHCTAAGITLAVAATMTGGDPRRTAALPDTTDMHNRVVLPACHVIDYGHSNLQAIRLAGAHVDLAGDEDGCPIADLEAELDGPDIACLMLVSSRLTTGAPIDLVAAIRAAHRRGVPAIIDGAAQFPRIADLLATGADLVLVSGQKYLGSPTAGMAAGSWSLVQALRAQEKGIGRVMKPTKEAIVGVLAALEEWQGGCVRRRGRADPRRDGRGGPGPDRSAGVAGPAEGLRRQTRRHRARGRHTTHLRDDRPDGRQRADAGAHPPRRRRDRDHSRPALGRPDMIKP